MAGAPRSAAIGGADRLLRLAGAGIVLAVLASGALAVGFGVDLVALAFGVPCVVHSITGIECPGCGITRALLLLGQGRFEESWGHHPLAAGVFVGALFAWRWPARVDVALRPVAAPLLVLVVALRVLDAA